MTRRLPAFGRELREVRARGLRPTDPVLVYLDRWPARRGPYAVPTLCVPDGVPAASLDWSIVRGLEVHLLTWTGNGASEAVDALMRAGVAALTIQNFAAEGDRWVVDVDARGPADAGARSAEGIAA
jgi:hypothetical protein